MAGRRRARYPSEYKDRIVKLVRTGRSPGSLAHEFEPSEQTIQNWNRQADLAEAPDQFWVADITHVRTWAYVPRRRARRLELADRGLGDGTPDAGRSGRQRAAYGDLLSPAERLGDLSFRSGFAVHIAGVRDALTQSGDHPVDGFGGRCIRQRDVQELLRNARVRTPDRRRFWTVAVARREIFRLIQGFNNTRRLHSALGSESLTNFEKLNHAA